MSRDDDIIASVTNAVEQRFLPLNDKLQKFRAEATKRQVYQNSVTIRGMKRICIDGYREMSAAAAAHVAEIEGEDSARHAEGIGPILKEMQPRIIELYGWKAQGSGSSGTLLEMAARERANLQAEMDAEVEHMARDLRLGVAGGMNVKKRHQLYIDNRGGAGQFAVNSPGATQNVGRDQTAGVSDFSTLVQLMTEARQQLATAGLSPDDHEVVEDAILAVEREAADVEPNPGRLKRLVLGVGRTARDLGVLVIAEAMAAYARTQGWM